MKKTLRVIVGSLNIGGTEKHLSMILPLLAKRGWQIKIITLLPMREPNFISVFHAAGISVQAPTYTFNFCYLPRFLRRGLRSLQGAFILWREFRSDKYRLTHFFLPQAYLLGMLMAAWVRMPAITVMSRRSLNYYQQRRYFLRRLELHCHRRVNFILANSERIMEQLHHEEKVPRHKLLKIYNGIDVQVYTNISMRHTLRKYLGLDLNHLVFIIIANLLPYKGHEDLLHALSLIRTQLPADWRLLCIGRDEGILSHLQTVARDLHLTKNISWLGVREDIPELLACADIGILCSHEEGFSNAILECMAAGLPMIVTDVGGNAEAVIHEQTGFVVPMKNISSLSQALLTLVQNKTLAKSMGLAGQKRVNDYFSLATCVAGYEKFYSEISLCVD